MSCIEQLTYNYEHPETVRELNLSATSHMKIHVISHIDQFHNLRSLVLSNNMIRRMTGIENLRLLRVLNLDFNQIQLIEATQTLTFLEELHLSYNEIEEVGPCLIHNRNLRALHLAYNDIRSLEGISTLYALAEGTSEASHRYALPHLNSLSLYGNPIISTINYLTFLKMLIPSLMLIDDKNVNEALLTSSVCPQEEVAILRDALDKLLDQRNQNVQELLNKDQSTAKDQLSFNELKRQPRVNFEDSLTSHQAKQFKIFQDQQGKNRKLLEEWVGLIEAAKQKYAHRLKAQKKRISDLSEEYTSGIKRKKEARQLQEEGAQGVLLNFSEEASFNDEDLSPHQSPQGRRSIIKELDRGEYENNKKILKQIKQIEKNAEENSNKVKNANKFLHCLNELPHPSQTNAVYQRILELIVFGFDGLPQTPKELGEKCYRLCKKFLINEGRGEGVSGMLNQIQLLKQIIFGSHRADPYVLKGKIKNKNLLEIIAEIKQAHSKQLQQMEKFDKQRRGFISKFEEETEELGTAWEGLNKERQAFEKEKKKYFQDLEKDLKKQSQEMSKKLKLVEEEEKKRIVELKRERDQLEFEVSNLSNSLHQTEHTLNRKFLELDEFQQHFNQFIGEKEKIRSLENDLEGLLNQLEAEQFKMDELSNRVKQLKLEEGISTDRLQRLDQLIKAKSKELKDLELSIDKAQNSHQKLHEELSGAMVRLRQLNAEVAQNSEESKDILKMLQRNRKNYNLMEDKLRNIEQIQTNKRTAIRQLESELRILKDEKSNAFSELEGMESNLEAKREELVRCQLKIQQSKLAMESLTDINKSINDMLIRQSELKRSIIELEMENKNLLEMKNNMMEDFRLKQYI